jgi:hypothetical protein
VTAAIFGLIGVIIGALITGGVSYALQVRLERRELRAVARLMLQELGSADLIRFALDRDDRQLLDDEPIEDEWKRHHLLLARHLPDDDWDAVALGYGERMVVLSLLVGEENADSGRRTLPAPSAAWTPRVRSCAPAPIGSAGISPTYDVTSAAATASAAIESECGSRCA